MRRAAMEFCKRVGKAKVTVDQISRLQTTDGCAAFRQSSCPAALGVCVAKEE